MNRFRRTIGLAVALVLCLAFAAQLRAQSAQASIDPARLPKNTVFYLLWRGAPAPAARSANSLYSLWDDAGFAWRASQMSKSVPGAASPRIPA